MPSSTLPETSSRRSVRALGAALFLLCGLLSAVAFISGMIVFGKHDVSYGCAVDAPTPPIGGPYYEDTRILLAERTILPLGAVCVLDSPEDSVGPQTVSVQSWPQTIGWIASGASALFGLLLLIHPGLVVLRHRVQIGEYPEVSAVQARRRGTSARARRTRARRPAAVPQRRTSDHVVPVPWPVEPRPARPPGVARLASRRERWRLGRVHHLCGGVRTWPMT